MNASTIDKQKTSSMSLLSMNMQGKHECSYTVHVLGCENEDNSLISFILTTQYLCIYIKYDLELSKCQIFVSEIFILKFCQNLQVLSLPNLTFTGI